MRGWSDHTTAIAMSHSTQLYDQLFGFLRQHCRAQDLRHLKALACAKSHELQALGRFW